ncbi:MAG: hypothetical protein GY756_26975 [bacterium]|nr:hypothetical protein [bacterium]
MIPENNLEDMVDVIKSIEGAGPIDEVRALRIIARMKELQKTVITHDDMCKKLAYEIASNKV